MLAVVAVAIALWHQIDFGTRLGLAGQFTWFQHGRIRFVDLHLLLSTKVRKILDARGGQC